MKLRSPKNLLGVILCLLACTAGCRWNPFVRPSAYTPPPVVFQATPLRDELIAALNGNSSRVQTMQATGSVSIPGAPSLTTEIALERPKNFRFRAGTALLGQELDLGSNSELFWFWAQRDPTRSLYYARHEQFAGSRARQLIPIEPNWLIEALGLVELDPQGSIEGPTPAGQGRVQLRVRQSTPAGEVTKVMLVDSQSAIIHQQQIYDPRGQLLATAKASRHQFYALDGISLPHQIDVELPQAQMTFQVYLDEHNINRPIAGGASTFELPTAQYASSRPVDIADPAFNPPVAEGAPAATNPGTAGPATSIPPAGQQPGNAAKYRGYTPWR